MNTFVGRKRQTGVSLQEYGILFGLVGALSILGLKALGNSTSSLISNSQNTLATNSPMVLLAPIKSPVTSLSQPANSLNLPGTGYYNIMLDPQSGQPTLHLVDGRQTMTNVSSVDGERMNTLGTVMIANKLQQMAAAETDPEIKSYYEQIASYSFYLGAAEAELDDVPGLCLDPPAYHYTNASALQDVVRIQQQIQASIQNPPAELDTAELLEVLSLGTTVFNIANNYQNSLQQFIQPDGTILDFGSGPSSNAGTGEPGSSLNRTDLEVLTVQNPYQNYADLIPYEQLKSSAHAVLTDNHVDSVPVETTLQAAETIDTAAAESAGATASSAARN